MNLENRTLGTFVEHCVGACISETPEMSDIFTDSFLITYFSECKSRGVQNENGIGSIQRG